MTDSAPVRIYPDTNILVSYSLGDSDENFELAEKLFEEVQNNKYMMVVSNFTLMETLHALRTIVTRMKYQELDNSPSQGDLIQIANSTFRRNCTQREHEGLQHDHRQDYERHTTLQFRTRRLNIPKRNICNRSPVALGNQRIFSRIQVSLPEMQQLSEMLFLQS